MKKTLIVIVVIVVVGGLLGYFYVFHKPHRNISSEKADFTESAADLVEAYKSNAESANAKYLDHVLAVKGTISEVDSSHVKLEEGVYCNLAKGAKSEDFIPGSSVQLKGRVVGYDELFNEVRMDFCEPVQ